MKVSVTCHKQRETVYEVEAKTLEDAMAQVVAGEAASAAGTPTMKPLSSKVVSMTMTPIEVG